MARRSADPDSLPNGKAITYRRSDRFLAGLEPAARVTFISHVHPDPDSLGSMLALAHLVEAKLGKPTRMTRDGLISRAENRAMADLLKLDLIPVEEIAWETEVSGYPRECSQLDDSSMHFLFPLADKDLLARIRNARLPHSHFDCLLQALQSSFVYDRLIITWVNNLPQPEQAAQVVDFMVR